MVVETEADLPQMELALDSARRLPDFGDRREEQPNDESNNTDDDQALE
jgi:hypothetical protein